MKNNDKIIVKSNNCLLGAGKFDETINIKFLKSYENQINKKNFNFNLNGILKLCLLKEISAKLGSKELNDLPANISDIMLILKDI